MLSPVRQSVICLSSVTFVHPTQPVEILANVSTAFGTQFYGDRPRRTPLAGLLNARGVAKYSDFGPIEDYISEMVPDTR